MTCTTVQEFEVGWDLFYFRIKNILISEEMYSSQSTNCIFQVIFYWINLTKNIIEPYLSNRSKQHYTESIKLIL